MGEKEEREEEETLDTHKNSISTWADHLNSLCSQWREMNPLKMQFIQLVVDI